MMFAWINSLSNGAASFFGTLTGSSIGLLALLIGALFNAHLNRKRDDRLRAHEARSVAAALHAELSIAEKVFKDNADHLSGGMAGYYMPDPKHSIKVMPDLVSKLGLFDSDIIQLVLTSYLMMEQYGQNLILMGGRADTHVSSERRLIHMPQNTAANVAVMNRNTAREIRKAISELERIAAS
jgi:hypothetical protein